jgi:hypothetical protein
MKQGVKFALILVLLLIPVTLAAASADRLVMTRADQTTAIDELVILLDVTNSKNLEALDIPLGYSEGAILEKVEFTERAKDMEFQAAGIDNESRMVFIGLMNMGPRSKVPDFPAGTGTVARMYFKLQPGVNQLEIVPVETDWPNHFLAWYYNDESTGVTFVETLSPEVINGSFRLDGKAIPDSYGLEQNSPNPFNPVTDINYALPQAGDVKMTIYNVLGQSVRDLVNGYQEAGNYTVTWDGKDAFGKPVASGVYFYRIKAGDYEKTRKMMLLK